MGEIIELSPEVFNRIAAGEVIENPASVVKELVENSLDAGADFIKIIIKQSGKKEITVADNGRGMSEEDALLSIKKHTTSKIKNVNDLHKIKTFGFRGEALSSIISVAIVDVITKRDKDDIAVKLHIENSGKDVSLSKAGANTGTTISVFNLFYNTPARLKFLKSDSSELTRIKNIFTSIAMANFDVRFELYVDNMEPIIYKKQTTVLDRLSEIYGESIKNKLIFFETDRQSFKIYGYAGKPDFNKPNRTSQFLFLNRRPIKTKFFSYWLSVAFDNFLMKGRHPVAFVFINASPEFVDVNVHPAKTEVRFLNESVLSGTIINSIRNALNNTDIIPEVSVKQESVTEFKEEVKTSLMNFYEKHTSANNNYPDTKISDSSVTKKSVSYNNEKDENNYPYIKENYFTLFNTYIFLEQGENVLIIDQHAAHERIIYERLKRDIEKRENIKQNLLIPININLTPDEYEVVKNNIDILESIGFDIEEFGINSYVLRSVPAYIRHSNDKELFFDIVAVLKEGKKISRKEVFDEILKTMSCKSAVKAGDYLNKEQKEYLIKELLKEEEVYNCPHGRPAVIKLSKYEIEKWFKRKL